MEKEKSFLRKKYKDMAPNEKKKMNTIIISISLILILFFTWLIIEISKDNDKSEIIYLSLNQNGELLDWNIKINNFYFTDRVEIDLHSVNYYSSNLAPSGNKWMVVHYTITNKATSPRNFSMSMSEILLFGEYKYLGKYVYSANPAFNTQIQPLATKQGFVMYEVPEAVAASNEPLVFVIEENKTNTKNKVYWKFERTEAYDIENTGHDGYRTDND